MCGISAAISFNGKRIDRFKFRELNETLAHRGPDGSESRFFLDDSLAFGFNRLAIIDLSQSSMQPISSLDNRYSIVFNGEIYNYLELRKDLEEKGVKFKSRGDAEVILNSYAYWGVDCFNKFNGMWAFIILDLTRRELVCARDRFGVKPMYFCNIDSTIYFASEIKAFAKLDAFDFSLDNRWTSWGQINPTATSLTPFKCVSKLLPGHYLKLKLNSSSYEIHEWWSTLNNLEYSHNDSLEELIRDAVKLRLRSDVPCAVSLSSGVDSTLIAHYASEISEGNVVAFCQANIEEPQQSELAIAQKTAKALGIQLIPTYSPAKLDIDSLVQSALALEGNMVFLPGVYHHYKSIKENGYKVVLEGHGGDELFGGYQSTLDLIARQYLWKLRIGSWKKYRNLGNQTYFGSKVDKDELLGLLFNDVEVELRKRAKVAFNDFKRTLFKESEFSYIDSIILIEELEKRQQLMKLVKNRLGSLDAHLYYEFHYGTLPQILDNNDKLSMNSGVEVRSPLLDWRVVTHAFSMNREAKLDPSFNKPVLRKLLPTPKLDFVRNRVQKFGFTNYANYLANNDILEFCQDIINSSLFLTSDCWNGPELSRSIASDIKNKDYQSILRNWGYIQQVVFVQSIKKG